MQEQWNKKLQQVWNQSSLSSKTNQQTSNDLVPNLQRNLVSPRLACSYESFASNLFLHQVQYLQLSTWLFVVTSYKCYAETFFLKTCCQLGISIHKLFDLFMVFHSMVFQTQIWKLLITPGLFIKIFLLGLACSQKILCTGLYNTFYPQQPCILFIMLGLWLCSIVSYALVRSIFYRISCYCRSLVQ